ncbi:MAG: hypothetical protein JNK47_12900 [Mesorhizobium sp.]|nr:hypothetical protein [Mesorhizobium sp.]MBL8578118.1 hypothetical protein [Mesorhizobium sp.]
MSAPSLYKLIATYWDRYDALCRAMDFTDSQPDGKQKEKAFEKQFAVGAKLDEAACAICAFVPTSTFEARIKHGFVSDLMARNGRLEESEVDALLSSIEHVVASVAYIDQRGATL